jgi:hypothetical protein
MNKNNPFVISCEKSSFLIEKKLAGVISLKEQGQLFVHKLICSVCRKYEKQSILLDALLRKKEYGKEESVSATFNKKSVDRLKLKILDKLK